mgnify:CR=1 FL=1
MKKMLLSLSEFGKLLLIYSLLLQNSACNKWGTNNDRVIDGIFIENLKNGHFDSLEGFHNGLARVEKDDEYGYINKRAEIVIDIQFDEAEDFNDGIAEVRKDGFYGIIDTLGAFVIPCEYETIES